MCQVPPNTKMNLKEEQRKERGKGLLDWVDKRVSCIKVAFGKRSQISKGVSQLMKESPGRGNSKCKGNGRHYVLQGEQEVMCMEHGEPGATG